MLLDTFMQGFIFTLVQQKWNRLSRYMFYTLRVLEAAYFTCIIQLSFQLKQQPTTRHSGFAVVPLSLGLILTVFEVLSMVLWWRNEPACAFGTPRHDPGRGLALLRRC